MIVPQFWAEASRQNKIKRRSFTVRRFGWSDASQEEAQANAEARADEALARIMAGEKLIRREPKIAYNGAEGVPIREEIISRHDDSVVTRNSYGAKCLNTPDVLFVDIDFENEPRAGFTGLVALALLICFAGLALWKRSWGLILVGIAVAGIGGVIASYLLHKVRLLMSGGVEARARKRIEAFAKTHPDWHLRLYRTPAGFRILVMHRLFDPCEEAVAECFRELRTDPLYAQMCIKQRCFRARVSPKPWRIGISTHMKPRPGIWPVKSEHLANRKKWIEDYDTAAGRFASCKFVESIGVRKADAKAVAIQQLHDELCRSASQLAIA